MRSWWAVAAVATLGLALASRPAAASDALRADPLTGVVVDAETGAPVPGAEVRVVGTELSTMTGAAGGWRLVGAPSGARTLEVIHIGYGAARRSVAVPAREPIRVALSPRAIPLGAMVVTGSRREQRLADVPVTTELVSRAQVERTGAADLAAVLTEQTGIQLQGGHPVGAGVMLQGLDAERVLVLVDGQPYVGRLSGTVDLSRIPAAMIERVEIVKGPQSTLYGSEAMGGVVNVITRRPATSWRGALGGTAGTEGRLDGHLEASGRIGGADVLGNVGHRRIELMPGQGSAAGALATRWDALGKARWSWRDGASVSGSFMLLDEAQRWRTGPVHQFADNTQWSARVGAEWLGQRHRLAPGLYATSFDHLSRQGNREEPPAPSTGARQVQALWEAELVYGFDGRAFDVDAGLEVTRERLESDDLAGGSRQRTGVAPYVQVPLELGSVTVVPGLRASWHDEWGNHFTPRVAALWRPVPSVGVRASLGRGYRTPAFKELYMEFLNIGPGYGYLVRGNSGLAPETSTNLTAGVEWTGERLFLRGQVFQNRFSDFIESRAVGDSAGITVYTYDNVAEGSTAGVETEAGVRVGGLRVEGGYAWLRTEDVATGEPLLGRPAHSARLSLSQRLMGRLNASLSGNYTGRTPLMRDEAGTTEREGYLRFDLRVAADLADGIRLSAGVDNLLDETPTGWPGFTGRQVYLTATLETDAAR